MTETITEDWLDILDQSNYEPDDDDSNTYQSYRFRELDINSVTIKNYEETLCKSLIEQVSMFIPPSGSFENKDLRRYLELVCSYETSSTDLILGLSLADQIRLTFSDMKTSTICDRYPEINLAEKRRYRCVAEYLIRQGELTKLRDENGKLIKKIGNMQKAVVLYRPLPKLLQTLKKSGLGNLIKIDKKKNATTKEKTLINLDNKVKT
jgi:hypothetical protein